MSDPAVTVVIPTIPIRDHMLQRALRSVERQTYPHIRVEVETDHHHTGAAATRQRALDRVETEYVAFLDDDDELWPRHVELCLAELISSGADLVYPWFEIDGGIDPFVDRYGAPFDEAHLRMAGQYIPITVLARTESVRAAGSFREDTNERGWTNEDYRHWLAMLDNGAVFVHLPKRTWTWFHHGRNTSGNGRHW